jgi:putative oxidoreductase
MRAFGPVALRLSVGAVFFAHGAQKLLGIWGGAGLNGTAKFFGSLGLTPALPLAALVAMTELLGGALLILGAASLWVSLALLIEMAVATYKVHYPNGFFLNWNLTPGHGHGLEFNLVLIGALLSLALTGPGALSFDERRKRSAESRASGRARVRKV